MLFNLCNESVSFQKYINNILCKHLNKFYTAYLNDILIYFNNELEHEIHVKLILRKLQEADLQMNIIKCKFHVTQVLYLELIIIIEEIKMNSSKIDIIVNWFILINVKDVQSFLNFANFYKRFIYDYSRITTVPCIKSRSRALQSIHLSPASIIEPSNSAEKLQYLS